MQPPHHLKSSVKMFCLPPAGCSANIYYSWKKKLLPEIEIMPLEYPGHGLKIKQILEMSVLNLAEQLCDEISAYTDQVYCLFGHSLGGALLWEVYKKLVERRLTTHLKMLIISARPEQHYMKNMQFIHLLNDQQLTQKLLEYNHIPQAVLKHPDLMDYILRLTRHDFGLSDQLLGLSVPFTDIPVLCIAGQQDPDTQNLKVMQAWQQYSSNWQGLEVIEGDHFYFNNEVSREKLFNILKLNINSIMRKHIER